MTYDGSININTKIDSNGVNQGVNGIKSALGGLKTALGGVGAALGLAFGIVELIQFAAACLDVGASAKAAAAQSRQAFGALHEEAEGALDAIADEAGSTAFAMRGSFNQIAAFAKTTGMDSAQSLALNGAQIFGMAGRTLLGGGEAGREAVLPLDRNTGWMDDLAERLAAKTSTAPITVKVLLDGKVVGETTVKYLRGRARQGEFPLSGMA